MQFSAVSPAKLPTCMHFLVSYDRSGHNNFLVSMNSTSGRFLHIAPLIGGLLTFNPNHNLSQTRTKVLVLLNLKTESNSEINCDCVWSFLNLSRAVFVALPQRIFVPLEMAVRYTQVMRKGGPLAWIHALVVTLYRAGHRTTPATAQSIWSLCVSVSMCKAGMFTTAACGGREPYRCCIHRCVCVCVHYMDVDLISQRKAAHKMMPSVRRNTSKNITEEI